MMRRVVIVLGSKGGSGATTIAFELAKRLGIEGRRILVDGDLSGRRSHAVTFDVLKSLDEKRTPGIPQTVTCAEHLLVELTNSFEDGFVVTGDAVEAILGEFPHDATIVVDAPQPFAAAVRPFINRATRFIVVIEPTLLGVSAARQLLSAMARFGIPSNRVVLITNSRDGIADLTRLEIAATLQSSVVAELPPRRDRGYGRSLQAFVDGLERLPHLEPLPNLRPSASAPIGDRRATSRPGSFAVSSAPAYVSGSPRVVHLETPASAKARSDDDAALEAIKADVHANMMKRIDFAAASRMDTDSQKFAELKMQVSELASELLGNRRDIGSAEAAARIKVEIVDEALGFGPIESLMNDDSITEIMVNGTANIYIERAGLLELTAKRFANERQVRLVIERVLSPLGRRIDESSPMVDARLPDGSRVNATIPPFSIDGPTLTIRRFGKRRLSFDDLVANGAITEPIVAFLRAAVRARLNIVVSGGTGSGKTTLLNAMSSFIPRTDRIVTIEDAAELMLDQPHVIRLESRPPNIEGRGEIRIRECVRNSLRMRPDRIVVGECRGAEALDMLQAMNTGHDGSLTTIHANAARDALSRIETMVLMAGYDLPVRAIREQVAAAIDIIVQIARLSDGSRKVVGVSEIAGMEGDVVSMQDLVRFKQRGFDANRKVLGEFEFAGVQPIALRRFAELGIDFDPTTFTALKAPVAAVWSAR